jgi:hypothetical protein
MKKLLHLVGCLHRCTGDARSHTHQDQFMVGYPLRQTNKQTNKQINKQKKERKKERKKEKIEGYLICE